MDIKDILIVDTSKSVKDIVKKVKELEKDLAQRKYRATLKGNGVEIYYGIANLLMLTFIILGVILCFNNSVILSKLLLYNSLILIPLMVGVVVITVLDIMLEEYYNLWIERN